MVNLQLQISNPSKRNLLPLTTTLPILILELVYTDTVSIYFSSSTFILRQFKTAFLLFEEPASGYSIPAGAIEHSSERPDRRKWNAMKFAKQYGLKLVGATFFSVSGAPAE